MGSSFGNKSKTKTELPKELERFSSRNLDLASLIGQMGYQPFQGPTVAGFSPQEMAAMQGVDQAASAFGMPSAVNWQGNPDGFSAPAGMNNDAIYTALTGMQPPNASMGGFEGYSAMPMYEEAIEALPSGYTTFLRSLFMDPETGESPLHRIFKQRKKRTDHRSIMQRDDQDR